MSGVAFTRTVQCVDALVDDGSIGIIIVILAACGSGSITIHISIGARAIVISTSPDVAIHSAIRSNDARPFDAVPTGQQLFHARAIGTNRRHCIDAIMRCGSRPCPSTSAGSRVRL